MAIRRTSLSAYLASPRLALGLMLYLGFYSFLGTLVAQGLATDKSVVAWAMAHRGWEPVVGALGLHRAYISPLFLVPMLLLGASTAVCAWRRTTVAAARFRALRTLRGKSTTAAFKPSFTVAAPAIPAEQALTIAETTLRALGWRTRRTGSTLTYASNPLVTVGSPLFHWALVALVVILGVGSLFRASGLMGVPVGESVPNAPASYRVLTAGPLHQWAAQPDTIGVESFELDYKYGGIDRGASPKVVVRSADGRVLKTQYVYPNSPLKYGSLIIHPNDYGLAATFVLTDTKGTELSRSSTLVDFDASSTAGTAPGELVLSDSRGQDAVRVAVSFVVPHDNGVLVPVLPRRPEAIVRFVAADGSLIGTDTLKVNDAFKFADGSALRFVGANYYARLSVVSDASVPALYTALMLALVGVTIALLFSQKALVATVSDDVDGAQVAVMVRTWRHGGAGASEIQQALLRAFESEPHDGSSD
jgi:cytochrome c biogenesis protein ResB